MGLLVTVIAHGTAIAATIVDSTWLSGGDFKYSNPANWFPSEVPNNSAEKIYNVTSTFSLGTDIDATVASLTMRGAPFFLDARSYTVTGTTTLDPSPSRGISLHAYSPAAVIFRTSALSTFSNGVLTGRHSITQQDASDGPAVLQFNGAAVTKLRNADLGLYGPMARLADEFGTNALTNLAEIDASSRLAIAGQQLVTGAAVFTNNGVLSVVAGGYDQDGAFTINGRLSNFEPATKTLVSGTYALRTASLRFPAADIVNNGASITLGPGGAILDDTGADALRNFARNLAGGSLSLQSRNFLIERDFSNSGTLSVESGLVAISGALTNDGTLSVRGGPLEDGSMVISGGLTNFDAPSKRLSGGVYRITGFSFARRGYLSVLGADIVHNSASIELAVNALFADEDGRDALRNFVDNEGAGLFSLFRVPFQAASDFTNAGTVSLTETQFTIPAGRVYRQTGGQTTISAPAIIGDVQILGGQLSGRPREFSRFSPAGGPGTINGHVTVGAALLDPNPLSVNGTLQLSDASRFRKTIGHITYNVGDRLTVNTPLALTGTFEILTPGGFAPASDAVYQVARAPQISGTFSNAPNGTRVPTLDRTGSFVVTYTSTDVTMSGYQRAPAAQLLNISTRAHVLTGDDVPIGGFIVKGAQPKKVLIRAIGPSLAAAGVSGPLQNPVIDLHDGTGAIIASNDDWPDTQSSEITATGIPPKDARESAIVQTLQPGAYTAVVRGKNDTTGEALVEVYDLSSSSQSKLANISTRGFVDADHVLIGGLIAGGDGQAIAEVLVRAIGRGLQNRGVQNFLPDAALQVRDTDGALVAANDDFGSPVDNQMTVPSLLQPTATDAATRVIVPPGNYTVIVNGKNGASGNALVEIYDLNP